MVTSESVTSPRIPDRSTRESTKCPTPQFPTSCCISDSVNHQFRGLNSPGLGMDRLLKSNTSKIRTQSLFRQGCMLYELIPNMPEHRLVPLIEAFARAISTAPEFGGFYA